MILSCLISLSSYSSLIDEQKITEIKQATNKAWVLGNECFKEQIAVLINRRVLPLVRGGDRRSQAFKKVNNIDNVSTNSAPLLLSANEKRFIC